MKLYPFQKKGVMFLDAHKGRGLIADEMGLGKTVQALTWLEEHPKARPALIIVPASVKLNWRKEARRWTSEKGIVVLSGRAADPTEVTGAMIIIINYDILAAWLIVLKHVRAQVVVLDECHYIKNKTKRTTAVRKICRTAPHIIALSGTPIVNRPIEIFNTLHILNPVLFQDRWKYARRYCDLTHNGYGWDDTGASHTEELHENLTGSVMIRRLKKDVLKELPPKVRSVVPLEIDNRGEYEKAEANFIKWLRGINEEKAERAKRAAALTEIEGLKQLTIKGKMESVLNWIDLFLDSGEKLVVVFTHKETGKILYDEFPDICVLVDGSVTGRKRQDAIDRFNSKRRVKLFLGNLKVMIGINLQTLCSNAAVIELGWVPGELDQAEDRIHRIGQKASVNIWYLLAGDTIEEKIAALLDKKRKVLTKVLDGKEADEGSMLTGLLDLYSK